MILCQLRAMLLGSLLAASGIGGQEASGDEVPTDSSAIEKTFIVDIARKDEFHSDISALDKPISGKLKLEAVDMPDMGISMVTGTFSEAEIEQLRFKGYDEADPFEVDLFDGATCDGPDPVPSTPAMVVPENVCRVVGPPQPALNAATVWIVDSGVDAYVFSRGLLNVKEIVDCTSSPCDQVYLFPNAIDHGAVTAATDKVGHGTMVAGIIGGKRAVQRGLMGVSPDAPLRIVKAFRNRKTGILGGPNLALRYVLAHAVAGDILNLSWGAKFLESTKRGSQLNKLKELDALLYKIADRQVRVVVAAGNALDDDEGPWLQSYFPANTAPYISPATGGGKTGAIYSVSASDSEYVVNSDQEKCNGNTGWCEKLWRGGAFGALYSEPGVNVLSLWKSKANTLRQNVCSGTSFAAPVLAGLLVPPGPTINRYQLQNELIPDADRLGYKTQGTPVDPRSDQPRCN